jgi:hypothetical protein
LTAFSACQARRGRAASTSCTQATIASRGSPPRTSADSTGRGSARVLLAAGAAAAIGLVGPRAVAASLAAAAASSTVTASATARRLRACGALDGGDRMATMMARDRVAIVRARRR